MIQGCGIMSVDLTRHTVIQTDRCNSTHLATSVGLAHLISINKPTVTDCNVNLGREWLVTDLGCLVLHMSTAAWPSHDLLYSEYDCSFLSPPAEAKSLIGQMLSLRQRDRPTLEQILNDPWMKAGAQSGKPAAAPSPRQPRANPSVAAYPTREALASNFTPPVSRCFGYCDSPKPPSSPCPPSVTPKGSPGLCRGMVEARP